MSEKPDAATEVAAIKARYARRANLPKDREAVFSPEVLLRAQANERALTGLLRDLADRPLSEYSVLEVGCGEGINLLQLIRLGFDPARLAGNDLRDEALVAARRILPATVRFYSGEASTAEFDTAGFDLVMQSTMFSSILDAGLQQAVAARMWALTRSGGAIVWYDMAYDNPWNPDVRGVPLARIRELFPKGAVSARRVTLAPPLGRRAAALHPAFYRLLDAMPFLRSHLLCWIAKA